MNLLTSNRESRMKFTHHFYLVPGSFRSLCAIENQRIGAEQWGWVVIIEWKSAVLHGLVEPSVRQCLCADGFTTFTDNILWSVTHRDVYTLYYTHIHMVLSLWLVLHMERLSLKAICHLVFPWSGFTVSANTDTNYLEEMPQINFPHLVLLASFEL